MNNMKNWIVGGVIFVVVALGGGYLLVQNTNSTDQASTQTTTIQEKQNTIVATVEVKDGSETKAYEGVTVTEGATALDLTEEAAEVETSGEGENAFITSINDRKADNSKNEFWELLINGEPAQVGAGSYKVQNGDTILWQVSTF